MDQQSYLIKPLLDKNYPIISHGMGVYLYDVNGKKYLDGSSGAVTASIGHHVQAVIDAMTVQAGKVSFVYRSQFSSEPAEKLAEKLMKLAPGDVNWSFFVNSGTESIETAMKVAIQFWQERGQPDKNQIISRWKSYHGITIGALSLSGHADRRSRFESILEKSPIVEPPYCYRCPFNLQYPECGLSCAMDLERAILEIGAENIAAFVAEPIVGAAAGAVTPPDGYYQKVEEICKKYEILFIADEVMTGIGRTGTMFAMEHWGVTPDIICIGKGMSAGYTPIAATLVSNDIIETIMNGSKIIMSGHTYSANPQSAAVALAVLKYIEKEDLVENARVMGVYLKQLLEGLQVKYPIIGEVRGKGLLLGLEIVADHTTKYPFSQEKAVTFKLIEKAQKNGLLIYPASAGTEGIGGDAIIIAPPLSVTKKEIEELISILDITLSEIAEEL
ncbi:adenosylmethionine-8-amino-7-oxononanoate aminotransferase [Bacillus tianshenii]|uniref:Adenosylmethionine-8-amino-7-oxononanoate aminotransferase n=1 Tax=Sutcliffiella tianshenii TaxID=1463404 RepID=A0ABS2NY72_9BACI|nr:aspartate aminotransferase family protein [Bacillus tianshenii]MBM7619397.1 adenosylmethionine-8-amino-7-oxononanoate aminotransferase [Bacillus tianshenii]